MKEKHPSMHWEVGDMTRIHSVFKDDGRFAAIVDKVGITCSFDFVAAAVSCRCFCFKRRFLFRAFICTNNFASWGSILSIFCCCCVLYCPILVRAYSSYPPPLMLLCILRLLWMPLFMTRVTRGMLMLML